MQGKSGQLERELFAAIAPGVANICNADVHAVLDDNELTCAAVGGRNPIRVNRCSSLYFQGFFTYQVVQDFFHQQ